MRAGWIRPSAISRSIAWRATSRRNGSKLERMMAPGVSSTISSTPVGDLERADVTALAADDPTLQVVARQIDDRHRGFDGVLGGAALDGFGDDLLRARRRRLARFGLEALDEVGRVAPRVGLDLLEQQLARLVGRQAGDALQLALPLGDELLGSRVRGGRGLSRCWTSAFSRAAQLLLEPVAGGQPVGERARLVGERLLEAERFPAAGRRSCALGFGGSGVRLFARPRAPLPSGGFRRRAPPGWPDAFGFGLRVAPDGLGGRAPAAGHPPEGDRRSASARQESECGERT